MLLYLIRHGSTMVTDNDFFRSHISKEGIRQAKALLESTMLPKPEIVYTSHFLRAIESGAILADHFDVFMQMRHCLGEWKIQELNLPFETFLHEEELARRDLQYRPPGGESFMMAQKRIFCCVQEICQENPQAENIVIVSHGNVLYLLFKKLLGQEPTFDEEKERIKNFDVGIVEYTDGKWKVLRNIITKPE